METNSKRLDIMFKLLISVFIVFASVLFTSKTWAKKTPVTDQQYTSQKAIQIAHRRGRHWRGRRGWRGPGWRVRYPYWGGWSPFWRGGVYCKKRCLYNEWGRVVRCRTRCF